jgi:hypothetical protein
VLRESVMTSFGRVLGAEEPVVSAVAGEG